MQLYELTPEQQLRNERRLKFAHKLMQTKQKTQAEIRASIDEPRIREALNELKQRNADRGTAVVRL